MVDELAQPVRVGRMIDPLPSKFFPVDDNAPLAAHVQRLREAEEEACRNIYAAGVAESWSHLQLRRAYSP